ncbi:putative transposase, Ptta/En/Spm, plant, transposase, Tnp1/En/Spm [Helianthus annuus]|nr:putative transposase, Ptta/En/Spm, plant, transposase, Tnp1/En/Spm [Helianthus annuus]
MEDKSMQGQSSKRRMNAYERSRMSRIQENQKKLQALGVKNIAKSLTSLAESDKTKKKKNKSMDTSKKDIDVEYMPGSDIDVEQDYQEAATKISKKSLKRYTNLAQKRFIAPTVSCVLTSSESHMQKGQVIDTSGRSTVAKRKLSAVDNDDDHGERDMRFHDINEEQDDVEFDDIEDIDMNEAYEEQDSFKDDGGKDMEDLVQVNDLENQNDELVEKECEDPENEEEHEGSQQENEAARNVRKRVRGPTRMPKVWAQEKGDRIPILVNEHGQPINDKSSQLTHFMGTLSRSGKYCPIYKPWNKVKAAKKEALLALLKTKFDIPEAAKGWILQSFGRKVKNWRARVKELYHDPSLSLKEQISSRPKQVQKKQWKKLVKYWNKEKSKLVSEKNKANRAKKKMVQLTGKKSYARVREELKASKGQDPSRLEIFRACFSKDGTTKNLEASNAIAQMQQLSSNLPEGSIDKPGPDDVFSKVMGNDRNGDAVMYGLGVRAADVWGVIPSRSACHRENIQLKSQCEELTSTVVQLRAQVSEMEGSRGGSSVQPLASQHFPNVTNGHQRLRVGDEVFLKSILNSTEIVARGRVQSLDPNDLVGGTEIGPEWCEVNVQVPIKKDENLVRPYGLFSTIQDCIGAPIAWPCPFISVVHED